MPEATFPDSETLTKLLENAVLKVLHTMAQMNGKFKERITPDPKCGSPFYQVGAQDPLIAGSVGFTGEANGMVYLYMEMPTAAALAARITGMEQKELLQADNYEVVKDVVGEMTNMTVGTFKNGICDLGFQCKVTLPTVLHGSNLKVESVASAQRLTYHFEVNGRPLMADVFIQDENAG